MFRHGFSRLHQSVNRPGCNSHSALGLFAVFLLFLSFGRADADWINLSGAETSPNIAEMTILDDRVRLALEIYVDDIEKLPELIPDDWFRENVAAPPPLADRMEQFSREKFQIFADDTTPLTANLRLSEPRLRVDRASPFAGMINPITRQKSPEPPADKRVLYVELDYPFEGKPETLSFVPPQDEDGRSLLPTGFIVYHQAVPVIDFRYLTDAVTLTLDWDDPWYSQFKNPNLKRHHRWPMMSFLYLEPREVRHEAVIRLRDLTEWIDLGVKPGTLISPDDQIRIREAANSFFAGINPVEIDGVFAEPAAVRSEFLELSLSGVQVIEDKRDLDPSTAVLGVILSYPVDGLPKEASVQWDLFNDRISRVPATSVDPAGPFPSEVAPEDPVHKWTNHLLKYQEPRVIPVLIGDERSVRIPTLAAGLAIIFLVAAFAALLSRGIVRKGAALGAVLFGFGVVVSWGYMIVPIHNPFAGPPGQTEAAKAIEATLNNANAAFLEVDERQLQSQLALFLAERTVASVTPELERAINIKVTGGTTARVGSVSDVTVAEILPLENGSGFSALAEWTAKASGQHWGHSHLRSVKYRARVDLVEDQREWRLAGLTVLSADLLP